ncbi:hypothetical protein WDV76_07105 [Xenorhabdus griffiniae]|uniref:hypothetical protein n=1 Tax=Xenorhabdus griffiniae TaxID=351672 RepID=UPI0030D4F897
MNNKLEEKLLLLRAKRYFDKIHGIENTIMSLSNEKEFQWHKEICRNILRDKEKPEFKLNLPLKEEDVCSHVRSKIHIGEDYNYYMFFEGIVVFSFNIINLDEFISSCHALKRTFDICLLLLNPMRVIYMSEEEYELSIFDISA